MQDEHGGIRLCLSIKADTQILGSFQVQTTSFTGEGGICVSNRGSDSDGVAKEGVVARTVVANPNWRKLTFIAKSACVTCRAVDLSCVFA